MGGGGRGKKNTTERLFHLSLGWVRGPAVGFPRSNIELRLRQEKIAETLVSKFQYNIQIETEYSMQAVHTKKHRNSENSIS